jgi:branched-chain amino acid transport system permease protein
MKIRTRDPAAPAELAHEGTVIKLTTPRAKDRGAGRRALWRALIGHPGPFRFGLLLAVIAGIISAIVHGTGYFDWSYALCDGLFAFGTGIAISWGGVPAFGQGLFFAIGGYSTALLRSDHLPAIVLLLIGLVLAGIVALLFAALTSSLPFIAFAMLSLVASQVGYEVVYTVNAFGGENGLYGIPRGNFFGLSLSGNMGFWWYVVAIVVIISMFAFALYRSVLGRSLRASRDDAIRVEAIGVNSRAVRVIAFTIGGAICGMAGVLYVQLQGVVDPSIAYWTQSADAVVMVVIGGLGTFYGAFGGGVLYEWIYLEVSKFSNNTDLWIGALLVVVVLAAPRGLFGLLGRAWRGLRRLTPRREVPDGRS